MLLLSAFDFVILALNYFSYLFAPLLERCERYRRRLLAGSGNHRFFNRIIMMKEKKSKNILHELGGQICQLEAEQFDEAKRLLTSSTSSPNSVMNNPMRMQTGDVHLVAFEDQLERQLNWLDFDICLYQRQKKQQQQQQQQWSPNEPSENSARVIDPLKQWHRIAGSSSKAIIATSNFSNSTSGQHSNVESNVEQQQQKQTVQLLPKKAAINNQESNDGMLLSSVLLAKWLSVAPPSAKPQTVVNIDTSRVLDSDAIAKTGDAKMDANGCQIVAVAPPPELLMHWRSAWLFGQLQRHGDQLTRLYSLASCLLERANLLQAGGSQLALARARALQGLTGESVGQHESSWLELLVAQELAMSAVDDGCSSSSSFNQKQGDKTKTKSVGVGEKSGATWGAPPPPLSRYALALLVCASLDSQSSTSSSKLLDASPADDEYTKVGKQFHAFLFNYSNEQQQQQHRKHEQQQQQHVDANEQSNKAKAAAAATTAPKVPASRGKKLLVQQSCTSSIQHEWQIKQNKAAAIGGGGGCNCRMELLKCDDARAGVYFDAAAAAADAADQAPRLCILDPISTVVAVEAPIASPNIQNSAKTKTLQKQQQTDNGHHYDRRQCQQMENLQIWPEISGLFDQFSACLDEQQAVAVAVANAKTKVDTTIGSQRNPLKLLLEVADKYAANRRANFSPVQMELRKQFIEQVKSTSRGSGVAGRSDSDASVNQRVEERTRTATTTSEFCEDDIGSSENFSDNDEKVKLLLKNKQQQQQHQRLFSSNRKLASNTCTHSIGSWRLGANRLVKNLLILAAFLLLRNLLVGYLERWQGELRAQSRNDFIRLKQTLFAGVDLGSNNDDDDNLFNDKDYLASAIDIENDENFRMNVGGGLKTTTSFTTASAAEVVEEEKVSGGKEEQQQQQQKRDFKSPNSGGEQKEEPKRATLESVANEDANEDDKKSQVVGATSEEDELLDDGDDAAPKMSELEEANGDSSEEGLSSEEERMMQALLAMTLARAFQGGQLSADELGAALRQKEIDPNVAKALADMMGLADFGGDGEPDNDEDEGEERDDSASGEQQDGASDTQDDNIARDDDDDDIGGLPDDESETATMTNIEGAEAAAGQEKKATDSEKASGDTGNPPEASQSQTGTATKQQEAPPSSKPSPDHGKPVVTTETNGGGSHSDDSQQPETVFGKDEL